MRVLLDENLPHALRYHLSNHETVTAAYAGLAGYQNGALLKAAVEAGFEVLVTADQTLQHEQNLVGFEIAIVLLSANAWRVIEPYIAKIVTAIDHATPGSLTQVDCGRWTRGPSGPG
jgi:predicted nuclease of predicted toxin-antitoxin system